MMKKKKIWRNSNENLAKMHEGRKKKNPVRGKMMDLNPIRSKKLKQEIGRGITEPRPHKRNKKNRLIQSGRRDIMLTRTREIRETFLLKKAMSNNQIQLASEVDGLGSCLCIFCIATNLVFSITLSDASSSTDLPLFFATISEKQRQDLDGNSRGSKAKWS